MRYVNDKKIDQIIHADKYVSKVRQDVEELLQISQAKCDNMVKQADIATQYKLEILSQELINIFANKVRELETLLIDNYNEILNECFEKIGFAEHIHYNNIIKSVTSQFTNITLTAIHANRQTLDLTKEELNNFVMDGFDSEQIMFFPDESLPDHSLKLETSHGLLYINIQELYSKLITLGCRT
jgi:hypothetical protein